MPLVPVVVPAGASDPVIVIVRLPRVQHGRRAHWGKCSDAIGRLQGLHRHKRRFLLLSHEIHLKLRPKMQRTIFVPESGASAKPMRQLGEMPEIIEIAILTHDRRPAAHSCETVPE
ncbi:MAG TPA: hypothetical protein VM008_02075 [Phycisphaerae bacterium]|nr:hypothetical protein [Phycisphaerae bacterium]